MELRGSQEIFVYSLAHCRANALETVSVSLPLPLEPTATSLTSHNDLEVLTFTIHMLLIWSPLYLPASVFLASAPARVGESLHFGKHCQQRLGSRNHNSIR